MTHDFECVTSLVESGVLLSLPSAEDSLESDLELLFVLQCS